MGSVWFTSDTHFHHKRCAVEHRGFSSVSEMNDRLVLEWNEKVKKGDAVYHLGDVSLGGVDETVETLSRLNGEIFLIKGNHDSVQLKQAVASRFVWIKDLHEFKTKKFGVPVVLCHYCLRTWNRSHYGAYQLHGHSHGTLEYDHHSLSMDVGVDCWDYAPISFDDVKNYMCMKEFKPIDHHKGKDA